MTFANRIKMWGVYFLLFGPMVLGSWVSLSVICGDFFGCAVVVILIVLVIFVGAKWHVFSLSKTERWKIIIAHFVILVVGYCLLWVGYDSYSEAGSQLTPASVHVSGYSRSDGTYVHEYYRRPPGGVAHDAPYQSEQSKYEVLMAVGGIITLFGGFGVVYSMGLCIMKLGHGNET